MPGLYSTDVLTGVVNSLQAPPQFLQETFFPTTQTEESEEIHFDQEADIMGLAPFVSPLVEGRVIESAGFTTKSFKPAYIKPKSAVDPSRAIKRYKGEPIAGNLSPEARAERISTDILLQHRSLIDRRKEWMASSVLRTGAVTISGELYQTVSVSFGRDAALTVTLTGGNRWGQAGIEPLDSLQDWADLTLTKSGSPALNVVMDTATWKVFRANATVKQRLDLLRAGGSPTMALDAKLNFGGTFMGNLDGFNIWVYAGNYKDDAGTVTAIIPSGTVIMCGDLGGVQAYGAILDEAAGLQALPMFSKSWVQQDPSRRFIMTQSAPLLVPYRVNATFCATVL